MILKIAFWWLNSNFINVMHHIYFINLSTTNQKITKLNIEMKELETYGDEILRKAISDLFSGKYEALEVIKLRDIYKEIENSLDTCYHISDMILNIALKQS